MKKTRIARLLSIILSVLLVVSFVGCNSKDAESSKDADKETTAKTGSSDSSSSVKEKEKVVLWYLWTGAEGEVVDSIAADFNAQSDKYVVEPLSVPDMQKVVVAISSGEGPDITDDFSSNVAPYASKGIVEPLDDYIAKSSYDISDFAEASIETCKWNGKIYALPIAANTDALFYNKTLLAEAGYNEPPKTMEELMEMAIATTKTNADGSIDVLGFPMFPANSTDAFIIAWGGGWLKGTEMNAEDPANLEALKYIIQYREKYGVDNVSAFQTAGKAHDPADPFFKGKQVFRISGSWLPTMIEKTFAVDIDYGICEIPYPAAHPELKGRTLINSSTFYIPSTAKNKDGAWEFLAYICSPEGQKKFSVGLGNIPTLKSLMNEDLYSKMPGSEFFGPYTINKNAVPNMSIPQGSEYSTIINEEVELALNLKKSPEDAIKSIVERSKDLF
ncbi:hypothetical protein CDQ84_01115 [Clostridium thermosuccinogenes]|uniref:ABC transporter substrate-binding protein n=1 Tax=Clostridium thermosuccinogenes TaxID=84032 RepID=A0A2K2FM49_9CLOT|nr:ABC transporter substrate-binding protein [Pseudoclostridium thermosuccinogenes]AUS95788.1 hypothetical protein CDO33_04620 [Pseudoclostridium thermosuccinogenes]PNT99851.1 hypothetical protein CDQ85_01115 [Pseudoclostridium thermosuccinogenes]PNU01297.1 hypothetical protein CDQ84_01115 [Pseudoclostridium thermosuccinogenes]